MGNGTLDLKELERVARKEAHYVAWVFSQVYELGADDREDLEQDLVLAVLLKAASYDRTRAAIRTFASAVIKNEMLHKARDMKQHAENPISTTSLYDVVGEDMDSTLLHETLDSAKCKAALGLHEPDPFKHVDLAHDLEVACKYLSSRQKEIANLLRATSKSQAARELGVTRSTVYRDANAIRDALEALDLGDYRK